MTDDSDGIPTAAPDQPTIVWGDTIRIQVTDLGFDLESDDSSDGIPCSIDVEHSATVAVVLTDLDEAFELVGQLARRDRIGFDIVKMPGPDGRGVIGLLVNGWRRFQSWFPTVIREAEPHLFRSMGNRKATAVMFRLRTLAAAFLNQMPPHGHDFFALRVE